MWKGIKQTIDELSHDEPGVRFSHYHERHAAHGREGRMANAGYMILGWGLTIVGVILMVLPIVPGFFLIFPGLAIVALRSRWAAEWLDTTERFVRRAAMRLRRRRA